MPRKRAMDHPPCLRYGSKGGQPRWVCKACRRSFGPTTGTPMYLPRTPAMAIGLTDHVWTWEEFLTFRLHYYIGGDYRKQLEC